MEHRVYLSMEVVSEAIISGDKRALVPLEHVVIPGLKMLKMLPNERIGLHTIDERLRLHGNSIYTFNYYRQIGIDPYTNENK